MLSNVQGDVIGRPWKVTFYYGNAVESSIWEQERHQNCRMNEEFSWMAGSVLSYKLRYIVGLGLVEMAISTNPRPTIYRNLYENRQADSCGNCYVINGLSGDTVTTARYSSAQCCANNTPMFPPLV